MNTLRVILIIFLFAASLYGEDIKPDEHNKKTVTTNDETEKEQIETAIDVSIEETDTELEDLKYKEKENDDKIDKAKTSFVNSSASNRKIIAGIGSIKKPKIISKKQTPAVISGTPPKRKKVQITTGKIPKSKPSQSIDLLKLKAKTQETQGNQQAERKFEDDVSDENEDSEVTASDIIKLIDNVDSLVRDKFNGDENKKENIANKKTKLTSIDNNKNVSSSVKHKERSTLSIKRSNDTRSDESTPLHNDEEQRNDGDTVNSNDVLSILETLRIDDNSEIQFFDDGDQNGGKKNETSQTNNKDTAITSKSPESNKNIQSENDDEHQVLPIVEKEIHNYKIDDEISIFDRKKKEKLVEPIHSKDDLIDDDFSRKQHENETSTEVVKNKVDNESNDGQKVETESEKTTKTVQHKENNDEYSVERKKDSKLLEEIPGQDNNKNGAIKIKKQESEKAKEVNDNDRHMDFNVKIMKPKIKTSTESVEDDDENGNVKKKREDSVKLTIDVDVKDKINDKVAVKIGQENKTETVISEDTDDDAGGQIKESEKTSSGVEEKKTHKDRNVKVKQQKNKAIDSVDDDNDNANAFENATTSADRSVKIKQEREESVEIALSKDNRKYTLRNHMRHNATEIAEDTSDKENGKTSDENVGDNNAETVEIKVQENKTSTGSTEDTDDNVERKNQGSGKETKDIHDMFDNEKEPFKIIKEQNAKALKSVQDKEKVGEVAHDDKIELLSDTSKRKSIKRKKAQLSLYSPTDDDDGNENEDLEQTTDEETLDLNVKKPLITVKDIHNTASDVVDMSMEESVKSRRLLAQLNETDDDTDGGEVSELVEQSVNTFVASNATFEETATDMPQTTIYPIVSPCSSSPCVYASSCEDRTRDYYCVCQAFYTGKQCDVLIDPCTTTPCPFGASCISNSTDYVCVCPDGFKGQRCEKIDTLVVCKDVLYKKDLSTDTIINCTRRLDTTPYDLCYDPDNNITFTLDDSTNGAIFGYNKHDFACLEANRSRVLLPKYCVNITATENDDKIYRPWRNATAKVCVIFNEPPQFTPTKLVTVNIRKATVGQPITDVNAVDNFVYSPVFKIIDVKPPEYLSCFSITFKGNISLAKIPSSITSGGQSVSIVVAVNDGGIPPLEATTTVTVTLVDIDLLCNFPREIYFGISSNTTILEDKIICTGATLLQYKLINSSGFPLMLGSNGSMVVMNIGLAPGSYEISVQVSSADNLASAFVNFTLHVGFYEPTCIRYSPVIQIHKSTPVGTCYPAFYCNETINSDIVCKDFVAGALDTYLSSKCNITVSKSIIHLCVVQKLKLSDGQYEVQQEIRNTYGTTTPKISVNIYNKPPKILNLPLSANVSESSNIGVLVMTIVVEDDYERPVVEIIGSNYPFTLNSTSGEVKISRQLDFETVRLYNLPIQVTDSEGLITTAVATINIIDVNENPLCSPGEYTTNINATTKVGSQILTVICTDLDLNDKLIYQINNSSQDVLDVFTIIQDTGVITLKRQPPPGKVYYQFKVIVTDKGGLTANVTVKVNFTFFPPNCGDGMLALEVQIKEDSGQNSCIPIVTNCVDPHGGKVNYTKASNTSLFDVYGADNGSLILCNAKSLQGLIRTVEVNLLAYKG